MLYKILDSVSHKDSVRMTTTRKFKKDLLKILFAHNYFTGDLLEIGTAYGDTAAILGYYARFNGSKHVYSFENDEKKIKIATDLIKKLNLSDVVDIIKKDVYKEKWNVSNISFIFIDCIHEDWAIRRDIENAKKVLNDDGLVVIHDYGLVTKRGEMIKNAVDELCDIVDYIGEEEDWNKLGSGIVIGPEAVLVKFKN